MTDAATIHARERQKELGAFYTPPAMAAKLVEWAVRSRGDRVLDPSFGGLVFLSAARDRLLALGADAPDVASQLYGIDLDENAHAAAALQDRFGLPREALLHQDFFAVAPGTDLPLCQAVVGNPPYIRYQGFNGSGAVAHELAATAGVRLTRLASSWAPFVVHATAFLASGGRLAQVLPAELLHAQYAGQVIEFLRRSFRRILIAVFDERVFPGALEEVVLLFADDRWEGGAADVRLLSCKRFEDLDLADLSSEDGTTGDGRRGLERSTLLSQLLPAATRDIYERVADRDEVRRLGDFASVGIGAVTGANAFFTLTQNQACEFAPELVHPSVSKASQVQGARLSTADHREILRRGQRGFLFVATAETEKAALDAAESYLARGVRERVHQRYKCRTREPWWAVPLPKAGVADLLLTYCSNHYPRLALNEARVLQTNTIHGVNLSEPRLASALAAGFYNSLTLLSAELAGRSYGGGVLKLEPTEAEALLLPPLGGEAADLLPQVDRLIRARDIQTALALLDPVVLGSGLGLSQAEIAALRAGAMRLRARRKSRGTPPARGGTGA